MEDRERCLLNIKEALQAMKAACSALETQIDLFLQLDFPAVGSEVETGEEASMEALSGTVADIAAAVEAVEEAIEVSMEESDAEPFDAMPKPDAEPMMPEPEQHESEAKPMEPEPEPVADSEPVLPEPEPKEQEAEPKPATKAPAATPKAAEESLGERFEQSRPRSLQSTFAATSGINIAVSVFSKRLSLNDRFRFQRELCHGDASLLQKLLEQLDATDTLDQAMDGLDDYSIDRENPAFDDLMDLIEQHFTRH